MIKNIKIVVVLTCLYLAPFSVQADTVRTKDGVSCSNSPSKSPLHMETFIDTKLGSSDSSSASEYRSYKSSDDDHRAGVRFKYYFGAPKPLNCDKLYQLELRSKQARLDEMEAKIELLKAGSNITWDKDTTASIE